MTMLGMVGKCATLIVYFGIYTVHIADGQSHLPNDNMGEQEAINMETQENRYQFSRPIRTAQEKVQMCGTRLRSAIENACKWRSYFSPDQVATSQTNRPVPRIRKITNEQQSSGRGTFLRLPRSVIEECCKTPCSPSELVKYCNDINPTASIQVTTVLPPTSRDKLRMRRPRKETQSDRKQQRKRNRVRINLPDESSISNDQITDSQLWKALECLLDVNCIANRKLNVPSENALTTNPSNPPNLVENQNDTCQGVSSAKNNHKRGRSSRRKKQETPSYLLPLLFRIIGYGLKDKSGWQEAIPVQTRATMSEDRLAAGDNSANTIGSFSDLEYYQRKTLSQKPARVTDDSEIPNETNQGPWEGVPLEEAHDAAGDPSRSKQNEESTPRESYRRRILPVTDAPLLSFFAIDLGTNDGIKYEQK